MKISGKYDFTSHTPEEVLSALTTPEILAKALPGCEEFVGTGDYQYDAVISIGVSAIKGKYKTHMALSDITDSSFILSLESNSSVGFVKLAAPITIGVGENGSGSLVDWEAEGEVGGLIAGVGNRILAGVAKMLVGRFFKAVEQQL